MTLSDIRGAIYDARSLSREADGRHVLPEGSRALLGLRDLLVQFLEATHEHAGSMSAMSVDQIRVLNQLHLAVGL